MIPAAGWASTVEVRDDVAVLVRRTDEPEYEARLVRAAEVLAVTDHPGVERLMAIESDDDGTTLTTRFAGGRSLAGSPPTDARGLASLAAALAQLLDDLHRTGTVHGPLRPHHVVLADGDRPVLCGFSAGQLRGELDDEIWSACKADDVRTLGALVKLLLDALPNPRGLAMRERSTRALLRRATRRTADGRAEDAAVVARWCASADGRLRTSRSAHQRNSDRVVHASTDPAVSERSDRRSPLNRRWRPSRVSLVGLLIGVTFCSLGVTGLVGPSRSTSHSSAQGSTAPSSSVANTPSIHSCPPPVGPADGKLLDVDGDSCPERVLVDGSSLVVAGVRYRLGQPGDLLEVGDWDGDGIATPALVRRTTGAVFAFASWPSPGQPLVAHPIARVHDVTHVQVRHGSDGHDSLLLDRSSGPPVPLDLDRPVSREGTP